MDFTFGTYNFLNGGIKDGDTTRLHRQLRRLREHRARAWAFQECSSWESNGCLEAAEDALDMRGFIAKSTKNPGGNVAVFIKTSDHKVKVIRTRHEGLMHDEKVPYWHAVAVVYVDIEGFGYLRLASGHLAPISPAAPDGQLVAQRGAPCNAASRKTDNIEDIHPKFSERHSGDSPSVPARL